MSEPFVDCPHTWCLGCGTCHTCEAENPPAPVTPDRRSALRGVVIPPRPEQGERVVARPMPEDVAVILLRALTWCGDQITTDQREQAWAWVEDARGHVEEMGQ